MGSSGDGVTALQQRLYDLGYYDQEMDGGFGGLTEEAVILFQAQNGLDDDGIASINTLTLLYSDDAKEVTLTPTPDPNATPWLVNQDNPVTEDELPTGMVRVRNFISDDLFTVKGSEIEGVQIAVEALVTMFEAAKADGVTGFQISSGYRSISYQQTLFDEQVAQYQSEGSSYEDAVTKTLLTIEEPGTSEHHTGLAFDITVADITFEGSAQQLWLAEHAYEYGLIQRYQSGKESITGFSADVSHYRYVGVQHSTSMQSKNLCLEEYVGAV